VTLPPTTFPVAAYPFATVKCEKYYALSILIVNRFVILLLLPAPVKEKLILF